MSLAWLGWEFEPEVSNTSILTYNVEVFEDKEFTFRYEWLRGKGLQGLAYKTWQMYRMPGSLILPFRKKLTIKSSTWVGY